METIYKLEEKFAAISEAYDQLEAQLVETYEDNGGEVTDETEGMQAQLDELAALKKQITDDIIAAPDEYAAIVKNAEAQQKILEAELKQLKEEQAKAVAKIQAKINRKASKADFFKDAIAEALRVNGIEKIGGAKTDNRFSIYFQASTAVDVDTEKVLAPYQPRITAFIQSLPSWISVKTDVNKTELKKADEMPEGASIVSNKSLRIR